MFKIASYAREESRKTGCTKEMFRAGVKLVEEAIQSMNRIDHAEIAVTQHPDFAPWMRLKWKMGKSATFRVIVELQEEEVLIHLVVPRTHRTYDEVEALWKQHRTKLKDDDASEDEE
ncbi:MAG: hypothetical protein AAFU54_18780 [Chloroflexota bacterium]